MSKIEKAQMTCEKVLDGIEDETLATSSVLLQCLKIARLLNDEDAIVWFQYEYEGYPEKITEGVRNILIRSGREFIKDGERYYFTELASELEEKIEAMHKGVNNFSTQGTSISGDYALSAVTRLTENVNRSTNNYVMSIANSQKRLSILRSKYYDYALKKQIEISFGNVATDIFSEYRRKVEHGFSELSNTTLLKLQAIEEKIDSDNPEMYSQALTTCRRLFENTAKELFDKYFPNYSEKTYKTKSGKEIDVSGDHYINKISAVIETLENRSMKNSIIGSSILYLIDWIENLNDLQCKGVHSEISKQEAIRCIIQTYICLGDILNLQKE